MNNAQILTCFLYIIFVVYNLFLFLTDVNNSIIVSIFWRQTTLCQPDSTMLFCNRLSLVLKSTTLLISCCYFFSDVCGLFLQGSLLSWCPSSSIPDSSTILSSLTTRRNGLDALSTQTSTEFSSPMKLIPPE